MSKEAVDSEQAKELLYIASMATQINKLAQDTNPPALGVAALASEIAADMLKQVKKLLAQGEERG